MLTDINRRWRDEFHIKYGRPPRILHVGNIANNAYLNAKFLNEAGFDCDVICYNYYHIMGCPEWEEADFDATGLNQTKPDWASIDLSGFVRPKWFAQGPQMLCIEYLIAKRMGDMRRADTFWSDLCCCNATAPKKWDTSLLGWYLLKKTRLKFIVTDLLFRPGALVVVWEKLMVFAKNNGTLGFIGLALFALPVVIFAAIMKIIGWLIARFSGKHIRFAKVVAKRVEQFANIFPERIDKLSADDCAIYAPTIHKWKSLFEHYDLVQAYATDVVYPMLAEKNVYVGFEHGTLRDFTLSNNPISRLTALGYQRASHVFITNGDCLAYAQQIRVESYTPMIHPVDDGLVSRVHGDYAGLHAEYGVKYLFFCLLRHDWEIKGTDKYIRSLPKIIEMLGRDFRLIMTRWGSQLDESIELAESLGVADLIVWIDPLNRIPLVRYQKSVDIVFDQISLPHFGATAPQAIAAGVPVIMSYDPISTEWIIPEPAPILSAWTEDEIVSAVIKAIDPVWISTYKENARYWFDKYHSASVVVEKHSHTYREIFRKKVDLIYCDNGAMYGAR